MKGNDGSEGERREGSKGREELKEREWERRGERRGVRGKGGE